ncbi:MAG: hypothetical protein V1822_01150 [Candidatus Micrarchaeota archaeon]
MAPAQMRQRTQQPKNEFENFIPSQVQQAPAHQEMGGEHGSLQISAYKNGYDNFLAILSETLDAASTILENRGLFPLTRERLSRIDLPSAGNIDVKFNGEMAKAELELPRIGGEPARLTAIFSPGHDSITISYPEGKFSTIDRNGRDMLVSEA